MLQLLKLTGVHFVIGTRASRHHISQLLLYNRDLQISVTHNNKHLQLLSHSFIRQLRQLVFKLKIFWVCFWWQIGPWSNYKSDSPRTGPTRNIFLIRIYKHTKPTTPQSLSLEVLNTHSSHMFPFIKVTTNGMRGNILPL